MLGLIRPEPMMLRPLPALLLMLALVTGAAPRGWAQEDLSGNSFITPFPTGDTYKLLLVGDSFAEGLVGGLTEAMGTDTQLAINRRHRSLTSLMRGDVDEDLAALDTDLQREAPNIVVMMFGMQDRISSRGSREHGRVGSDTWREEYGSRVDKLLKLMKRRNIAVYWVGLPIMRRPDHNDDAQMMNEIYRERSFLNGMKYIDAAEGFSGEEGRYEAYGPDLTGKSRLMREGDGIHFTTVGSRKLASFVEREVKRDLTRARAERNIPLAGGDAEQMRIRGSRPAASKASAPAATAAKAASPKAAAPSSAPAWGSTTTAAPAKASGADEKADNSRVTVRIATAGGREEAVTLDIVRPAIPASVIALVTRREATSRGLQSGEPVVSEIAGGLTVLSSIISVAEPTAASGRRGSAAAQSIAYRLLIRGEHLTPKPGRIDDFTWPRPDTPLYVPPASASTGATDAPSGKSEPTRGRLPRRIAPVTKE
jgi:hypothetical protein